MDKKKAYEAPSVKKIELKVKNAVLAICRTSSGMDVIGAVDCTNPASGGCYNPS
ncbi:MAG TPA: hypothetical protein P5184_11865 [Bacteroidales bacterium]|nr:hypothetical protein [Bacteroidales bacterium]